MDEAFDEEAVEEEPADELDEDPDEEVDAPPLDELLAESFFLAAVSPDDFLSDPERESVR